MRHTIVDLYVMTDKLHHEISLATELDRTTVDRVMAEAYQKRQRESEEAPAAPLHPAREAAEVAETAGVRLEVVEQIFAAEAAWMLRRGYIVEVAEGG
jgi:hypothetical protein